MQLTNTLGEQHKPGRACDECHKPLNEYVMQGTKKVKNRRKYCPLCHIPHGLKETVKICPKCNSEFILKKLEHEILFKQRDFCESCFSPQLNDPVLSAKIKEDFLNIGCKACSEKYGVSRNQVKWIAKKHGLRICGEIENGKVVLNRSQREDRHKVNHHDFISVKTPVHAYLLGAIWTDGHVCKSSNNISFHQTLPDANCFVSQFLKTGDWAISFKKVTKKNCKNALVINTTNRFLKRFLVSHNYTDKEKGCQSIYNLIPDNYKVHFLRGIVDGDGCFYTNTRRSSYSFCIASSYNQNWECFTNIFKTLKINHSIHKNTFKFGKNSTIRIIGKERIKRLGDYIYESFLLDGIGLQRKYDSFSKINGLCHRYMNKKISKEPYLTPEIKYYPVGSQNVPIL